MVTGGDHALQEIDPRTHARSRGADLHRRAPTWRIRTMSNPSPAASPGSSASPGLKLNLGSGQNPKPGYVNVDKYGSPDVLWDLEQLPWPWDDNAVEAVEMIHVLEHLGAQADGFIGIMKELYRVCRHDATIIIMVPHPRCDDFLNDPTHVRIITPEVMSLFSKRLNLEWKRLGAANSPLALYHDVDFEIKAVNLDLTPEWSQRLSSKQINQNQLMEVMRSQNNVVKQTRIELKVVKG
jgi:hypothetical protein